MKILKFLPLHKGSYLLSQSSFFVVITFTRYSFVRNIFIGNCDTVYPLIEVLAADTHDCQGTKMSEYWLCKILVSWVKSIRILCSFCLKKLYIVIIKRVLGEFVHFSNFFYFSMSWPTFQQFSWHLTIIYKTLFFCQVKQVLIDIFFFFFFFF